MRWLIVIVLSWLVPLEVTAFVDPPRFQPAIPLTGQPIVMQVRAGQCELFTDLPHQADVTTAGSVVTVVIGGDSSSDLVNCNAQTAQYTFNLGGLPAGTYTVAIRIRSVLPPFQTFPVIASSALLVRQAPAGVPAMHPIGFVILTAFLGLGALFRSTNGRLRRSRHGF